MDETQFAVMTKSLWLFEDLVPAHVTEARKVSGIASQEMEAKPPKTRFDLSRLEWLIRGIALRLQTRKQVNSD